MKRFVFIGEAGCGADMIARALAADEQCYVFGELFHANPQGREAESYRKTIGNKPVPPIFSCYYTYFHDHTDSGVYVHNFLNMPTVKCNSIGFTIYHTNLVAYPEAEAYLRRKPDIHLIHVLGNPLHALAKAKMDMTGSNQIYLSSTFVRNKLHAAEKNKERVKLLFSKHPTLEVEFPKDFPACMKDINSFLGTSGAEESKEVIEPFHPANHIMNYDLIRSRFEKSIYEKYFD